MTAGAGVGCGWGRGRQEPALVCLGLPVAPPGAPAPLWGLPPCQRFVVSSVAFRLGRALSITSETLHVHCHLSASSFLLTLPSQLPRSSHTYLLQPAAGPLPLFLDQSLSYSVVARVTSSAWMPHLHLPASPLLALC